MTAREFIEFVQEFPEALDKEIRFEVYVCSHQVLLHPEDIDEMGTNMVVTLA